MAMITLTQTFVNLMTNGAAVSGLPRADRDESYSQPGEVRTYAGGRRRSITQLGETGTYRFTLLQVPRTTVETLRSWIGDLVEVRDSKGRQFFGVFFAITPIEVYAYVTNCNYVPWHVTIELTAVTT
jgi:hypothetical protein